MAAPIDRLTKDSYDLQFGTNVLGHFHLTSLLLPALLASPSPRVVNVSSIGHRITHSRGIQFETLKGPNKERGYLYSRSSNATSFTDRASSETSYMPTNWRDDIKIMGWSLSLSILASSRQTSCVITPLCSRD